MANKAFSLRSPCKDCPFKKDMAYLNGDRIKGIFDSLAKMDDLFRCHKTTNSKERLEYEEAISNVEDLLRMENENLDSKEYIKLKDELYSEFNIKTLKENLLNVISNKEKICAGLLILGKKENVLQNNYKIRLAIHLKLLDLNQFKNEDEVFNSLSDAIESHDSWAL